MGLQIGISPHPDLLTFNSIYPTVVVRPVLLNATSQLFIVHPTLSLATLDTDQSRLSTCVHHADFDRSILEQIDDRYDLLVLDWGLEAPDARGILDIVRQRAPEMSVLVLTEDIPTDDPVDRGANELLTGPVSDETLHSTIERLLLQKAYEEAMNEFYRLATERALLESELESGLDVANRYQSVVYTLYECRTRAGAIRDELSGEEFDQTLRQLLE